MIIINNRFIPFRHFMAINLFGVIFVKKNFTLDDADSRHELNHTLQIREMLFVFFYLWYIIEWIIRLFMKGNAYRQISFEREAYSQMNNPTYLQERKPYAWIKYLKNKKPKKNYNKVKNQNKSAI